MLYIHTSMYLKRKEITLKKSKEEAEKTRQALLEAALDVFSEKGFAKSTFDEIAQRAGFTKGAIYWYFKNKADLLSALIVEYVHRKQLEIERSLPKGNTLEDLIHYFMVWAKVGKDDARFAKFHRFILCQMEWSETIIDKVERNIIELKNFHLEKINKVLVQCQENGELKDDVDINKVQHIIMSDYMGVIFSFLSKRFEYDVVDMVRSNLELLIAGIKK